MARPIPVIITLFLLFSLAGSVVSAAEANQGFIYGTVTLQDGDQHTGFLRWDSEEAFWDDLFHSRQQEITWLDFVDADKVNKERKRQYYKTHGLIDRIAYSLENKDDELDISRLFIAQFGDLDAIHIDDDENITVELNDGSRQPVRGYSNDVSADIIVYVDGEEAETIDWDDLAEIRFTQVPTDAVPYAERLYGKVTSKRGDFEGFIQWDKSECTSIDILDSRQEDVAMGDIRKIERDPGEGSIVTLKDGEVLNLSGSNDVGRGHRGVVVETANQGRVVIPWKRFIEVEFVEGMGSGAKRSAYADNDALNGTVTNTTGDIFEGRIVYDLDESRRHDLFEGNLKDVAYNIRFDQISTISPAGPKTCRLELRDGQTLTLDNEHDTGQDNGGVLIFPAGSDKAHHVLWSQLKDIHFHR